LQTSQKISIGDLVILDGGKPLSPDFNPIEWTHFNKVGLVIEISDHSFLVMFNSGSIMDFTGYHDYLSMINAQNRHHK